MFLGIEIGGTKLQLGIGPGDGTIVALERARVDPTAGADRIRRQIIESIPAVIRRAGLEKTAIRGIGIGFGGPVDAARGVVTKSHHVEGWAGFELADWSRRELGWPTTVQNDADTAGWAEACFGAGRGLSPIFYITIGSGIGGGLIIDRKIYRGSGAGASEIGHVRVGRSLFVDSPSEVDAIVPEDTVESICSGWGLTRRLKRELESPGVSGTDDARELYSMCGQDLNRLTAELIGQAAQSGNRLAHGCLNRTIEVLGWAIGQMITLLSPRRIVIGGGVSLIGERGLFMPLRLAVDRWVFPPFRGLYDIVPAALGEAVVVHGAIGLAREAATVT